MVLLLGIPMVEDTQQPDYTTEIKKLLRLTVDQEASDLHLAVDEPVAIRIDGKIRKAQHKPLSKKTVEDLIYSMLTEEQIAILETKKELDCAIEFGDIGRFRVNVGYEERGLYATLRYIKDTIPEIAQL